MQDQHKTIRLWVMETHVWHNKAKQTWISNGAELSQEESYTGICFLSAELELNNTQEESNTVFTKTSSHAIFLFSFGDRLCASLIALGVRVLLSRKI